MCLFYRIEHYWLGGWLSGYNAYFTKWGFKLNLTTPPPQKKNQKPSTASQVFCFNNGRQCRDRNILGTAGLANLTERLSYNLSERPNLFFFFLNSFIFEIITTSISPSLPYIYTLPYIPPCFLSNPFFSIAVLHCVGGGDSKEKCLM